VQLLGPETLRRRATTEYLADQKATRVGTADRPRQSGGALIPPRRRVVFPASHRILSLDSLQCGVVRRQSLAVVAPDPIQEFAELRVGVVGSTRRPAVRAVPLPLPQAAATAITATGVSNFLTLLNLAVSLRAV
jgi:hypothetical protein